jgi:hypothetical protein
MKSKASGFYCEGGTICGLGGFCADVCGRMFDKGLAGESGVVARSRVAGCECRIVANDTW